ncbi:DUF4190 domain-containing protein [Microbacterium xanthum]|uniref:DUF4190 domain-containing protein n=1 Tax=Microbacterium xanthum TaxID=3079794 RepID=UPI002AD4EAD0|nr:MULTISPECIES: DUF4190 domain-containing protein [unclassified Microbacterium]MDZ8171283.1 DUF4190 domain-containing protein [Microbacterium sp. KSW-48]MDZ8201778.1 DUF4190 domain-containing protein [Microbacterium sp. SSW1-59]
MSDPQNPVPPASGDSASAQPSPPSAYPPPVPQSTEPNPPGAYPPPANVPPATPSDPSASTGSGQAAYPPPAHQGGYPAPGGYPVPEQAGPTPGKTLGIVALVLAFFIQLVALILGIVALVQSRKAGAKNGFAVAAIIISSVFMVIGIIIGVVLIAALGPVLAACAELGPGVWELTDGTVITCG